MSTDLNAKPAKIAIAGATGRVGSSLVDLLAADDVEVSALTRHAKGSKFSEKVALAEIAFDRPETLRKALEGADRLFISQGSSPQQVENEIALIDAATAVGVRHVVKLSSFGPPSQALPNAWHMRIEDHLSRQDVAFTVLRPTAFANIVGLFGAQVAAGTWTGSAGSGRVNFVETLDVARVARVALLEQVEPSSQRVYHLTGARAWTMAEIAGELSALLRRPVVYRQTSPAEERDALLAAGMPPARADLLAGIVKMFRDSAYGETTRTVHELTGSEPRPLTEWLKENIGVFGG